MNTTRLILALLSGCFLFSCTGPESANIPAGFNVADTEIPLLLSAADLYEKPGLPTLPDGSPAVKLVMAAGPELLKTHGVQIPDQPETTYTPQEEVTVSLLDPTPEPREPSFEELMDLKVRLPFLVDSSFIAAACLQQFTQLANSTDGEISIVANTKFVSETVNRIIKEEAGDNTDIMIVLDKTSSMRDDFVNIKGGLKEILKSLRKKKRVRLAVASYGDRLMDGRLWYDFKNFENDFQGTMDFINRIRLTGGGDFPESVYDGVYQAFQEDFFRSDSKRIVILLGDAPSLTGKKTNHTAQEIIDLATRDKVYMNFYPVVLSPFNGAVSAYGANPAPKSAAEIPDHTKMQDLKFITKAYPNPSNGPVYIELSMIGDFTVEIFNQNGQMVRTEQVNNRNLYRTDLGDLPNGLYIFRVYDENKNFGVERIVLSR